MATDLDSIGRNLCEFYDFKGKTIITIGAGSGRSLEYARHARFVIAVDKDGRAIDRLIQRVREAGLANRFFMFVGEETSAPFRGDVVLFEFSLHEIPDSRRTLEHARRLAPEIVIMDHAPGSPWSRFAGEEDAVERCWAAVPPDAIRCHRNLEGLQQFGQSDEMRARFRRQAATSHARIAECRAIAPIAIPMPYRLALVDSCSTGFTNRQTELPHEQYGTSRGELSRSLDSPRSG